MVGIGGPGITREADVGGGGGDGVGVGSGARYMDGGGDKERVG